jgi:hypothetical protein
MLRPTVSRPVCLRVKQQSGAYDQIFVTVRQLRVFSCGPLSLTRERVCRFSCCWSRQRSHSWVPVQRDFLPYFTLSDSRLPQTGGQGSRIYIAQEQGGPVIPPGTGFPLRCLLRLAGLRWRYWTPPSHGLRANCLQGNSSARTPRKTPSSFVKHACLQLRCLAMDALSSISFA